MDNRLTENQVLNLIKLHTSAQYLYSCFEEYENNKGLLNKEGLKSIVEVLEITLQSIQEALLLVHLILPEEILVQYYKLISSTKEFIVLIQRYDMRK